jgi:hypothetical protein
VYESPATQAQVRALSIEACEDLLRVEAHIAFMRHRISGDMQDLILALLDGAASANKPGHCRQLNLFSIPVHDILLIGPASGSDAPQPVVAYMPGIGDAPLQEFASMQALQTHLQISLCTPGYREHFQRFIPRDQHDHFFSVLKRNLDLGNAGARDSAWTLAPNADLHLSETPIEQPLFGYLQDRHLSRIKQEARVMAVPTADADEKARQARLDFWESTGLNVLNAAALFVPGLGEVMLAVVAIQLLKEVYDGIEAWEVGDIDLAMMHLKAVALNVAVIGAGVAIAKGVSFMNRLKVVERPNGKTRLRNAELPLSASEVEPTTGNELSPARPFEGLNLPALTNADSDRLVLACLGRLQGWPDDLCLELRGGSPQGPLLERLGSPMAALRRTLVKNANGYCAYEGSAPIQHLSGLADDNDLFTATLHALPDAQRQALGLDLQGSEQLQARVRELADQFRHEVPRWLWSGHTRGWSDQGRLLGGADHPPGYPAAGPQSPTSLVRYRRLYPAQSDAQAQAALDDWQGNGQLPNLELRGLENQLRTLRRDMNRWAGRNARRLAARRYIIDAWQRVSSRLLPDGTRVVQLNLDHLELEAGDLAAFPQLEASFDHVTELSLDENRQLAELPTAFSRHFTHLRRLSMQGCRLATVPAGLNPEQLVLLDLSHNRITWDDTAQATLDAYPRLQALDLSGNPLLSSPDLSELTALVGIDLSECSLSALPGGLQTVQAPYLLDLSGNALTDLPEDFLVPDAVGHALSLERNPLSAAAQTQIEQYHASHGVDLLVAQTDYDPLLEGADPAQREAWERLRRTAPLEFVRNLRDIYSLPEYAVAPATTCRRLRRLLQWIDRKLPAEREPILQRPVRRIFELETAADVSRAMAADEPRLRTEQLLAVAVNHIRVNEVSIALDTLFPEVTDHAFEAMRQWSLQQLAQDPAIDLLHAPTPAEDVFTDAAGHDIQLLTPQWREQLRVRLLNLTGRTEEGIDAILARDEQDEFVHGYWPNRLRQRYATQYSDLRSALELQLDEAAQNMPEGDFIEEAMRLRDAFEQQTTALNRTLTRSIAEGNVTEW